MRKPRRKPCRPGWPGRAFGILALVVLGLTYSGCQRQEITSNKPELTYAVAGRDINVTPWEPELPADIVLVIDQSGSMSKGRTPTDAAGVRLKGSLAFLEFVAGRSRVNLANRFGVVNFGTEAPPKQAVALTPILSVDDAAIKRIGSQLITLDLGDTSFINALRRAMQLLQEGGSFQEPRNRAVVIFTDGEPDDPRKLPLPQYFAELRAFIEREVMPRQVSLFVVGIDANGRRWSATVPSWQRLLGGEHVLTTPSMDALNDGALLLVQQANGTITAVSLAFDASLLRRPDPYRPPAGLEEGAWGPSMSEPPGGAASGPGDSRGDAGAGGSPGDEDNFQWKFD